MRNPDMPESQALRYIRLNGFWRMMAPAILQCNGDIAREDDVLARPGIRAIREAWEETHSAIYLHEVRTSIQAYNDVAVSAAVIETALSRNVQ